MSEYDKSRGEGAPATALPARATPWSRFWQSLQWRNLRLLLFINLPIAAIFSVLDYTPRLGVWMVEVLRNLVITFSIGGTAFALAWAFDVFALKSEFRKLLLCGGILAVAGSAGAAIAFAINRWLFGFQVTSFRFYIIQLTALTLCLGILPFILMTVLAKWRFAALALKEQELNAQRLLQAKTRAELEALRAKVHPHFLFNALNSIASLIPSNPGAAEAMVEKLADLFRYTLNAADDDLVTLESEFEVLEAYLEIERLRLGERLSYNLECPRALRHFRIPGLLLQPLVENSVIHGIAPSPKGGHVAVRCQAENGGCRVTVQDSGVGFSRGKGQQGFGLFAVTSRLELLYGENFDFSLSTEPHKTIRLWLPPKPEHPASSPPEVAAT